MNKVAFSWRPSTFSLPTSSAGKSSGRSPPRPLSDGGSREIGGELEDRHSPEFLDPVVKLRLQDVSPEPLELPVCIVGVLDRQARQGGGAGPGEGFIQDGGLADHHAERPGVGHDVVDRDQHHVLPLLQAHQQCAG